MRLGKPGLDEYEKLGFRRLEMSMSNDRNPLEIAKKLGTSIGGKLGQKSFEELELALVTKLFPKKFANIQTLRTRQHILLYWRRGFLKTTLLREFSKTIPEQFKVVHLSSVTTEILCGSIYVSKATFQQPRIIPPVLTGADFAIVTEHSAFLKHGGPIVAKLSILNDILEGDRISNTLVKLGQVQIDPTQKPELEKLGVRYDPSEATISYEPDVLMLSASHPFDRKTLSVLIDSGHFDRFFVLQARITPEIAKKCFKEDYSLDKDLQDQLKQYNERLCRVKIKYIDAPPHVLLKPVYEKLFTLTETPDFRIKGDILRTAAAHMVLRHFSQGNVKEIYTEQDYSLEDVNFISEELSNFVEPRLNPLVAEGYTGRSRKRDFAKNHICSFLEGSKREGKIGEPLRAIVAYVHSKMPYVHYQTINNAKNELIKEGKVEKVPGTRGYYRLVEKKVG